MIRSAGPADAPRIAAIYAREVLEGTATFELEPPDADEIVRRMEASGGRLPWLMLEEDGAALGYAYAGTYNARPAYRWTVETTIYVARTAQRRGVGRLLYGALLETLERQGFAQAIAIIGLPNPGSVTLHEALGFRAAGKVEAVGYKFGRWLDVGYWRRPLATPGDPPAEPRAFRQVTPGR